MRNVTGFIALSVFGLFVSCASDKAVETEEAPAVTEVEVVKVETSAPESSTEVSFGKDGASVKTKDGQSGTSIEVKDGSTKIKVKGE